LLSVTALTIAACGTSPAPSEPSEAPGARNASGEAQLEAVAALDVAPGNITVTPQGLRIISLHNFHKPDMRVAHLAEDGTLTAFPNEALSTVGSTDPLALDNVLGLRSDSAGRVWMLDMGNNSKVTPKIVAWDTVADELHRVVELPAPATVATSAPNDLVLDEPNGKIYIADPAAGGEAALIVVDTETGSARRVLQGHRSTVAENVDLQVDGRPTVRHTAGRNSPHRTGVDSIALDSDSEWLYYGPLHGATMYRIPTAALNDVTMPTEDLAAAVESYSEKPFSDGISIDNRDNLYVTDMANDAITVIRPDRSSEVFVQDERLNWPDALSYGPDGQFYVVTNQLHLTAALNGGQNDAEPPFHVLRFAPLSQGRVGH
jgi:sugar lactone lactonase YvrE